MKFLRLALSAAALTACARVTDQMSFPDEGTPVRMRHGTVIAVPAELVAKLKATSAP